MNRCLPILCAVVLSAACASSQEADESDPRLVLRLGAERYVLDQPVKVYLGVHNAGKGEFRGIWSLFPECPPTNIELREGDDEWVAFKPVRIASGEGPGFYAQKLGPGETMLFEYEMRRVEATSKQVLHNAGSWSARLSHEGQRHPKANVVTFFSETSRFVIEEPKGKDADARRALEKAGHLYALGSPGGGTEIQRPFPDHLAAYGGTAYGGDIACTLAVALGDLYQYSGAEYYKKVEEILDRFEGEWAAHQQAPFALTYRARTSLHARADGAKVAQRLADTVAEKWPFYKDTLHYRALLKELKERR